MAMTSQKPTERAIIAELVAGLQLFTNYSMSSSNSHGETSLRWQVGDGLTALERVKEARLLIAKAVLISKQD